MEAPDYLVMEYIEMGFPLSMAWPPDGRILAIALDYRGTLWKFQPHPEVKGKL